MQGAPVWSLSWKDPTCGRAGKPMIHNYRACTAGGDDWAHVPRPLKPVHLEPVLCNKQWESLSCSVMSNSLRPHGLQPSRPLCPWDSPGKKTGVGCHSVSRAPLQPRVGTCIVGRFFTVWATPEMRSQQQRVAPPCHNWRKPACSNEDPVQPKLKNLFLMGGEAKLTCFKKMRGGPHPPSC